jgi:mRNA deadenylase 3'-5' endonuclease subunit Ccr4
LRYLGPLLAVSSKHNYAPQHVRNWEIRQNNLLREIQDMDADVLCLQEVSDISLQETFVPTLEKLGLTCAGFAPSNDNTARKTAFDAMPHSMIGSAIFCKTLPAKQGKNTQKEGEMLTVLSSRRVLLKDFAPLRKSFSRKFVVDVQTKPNSMVMAHVKLPGSDKTILVANTHLYWNPQRQDIKTMQLYAVGAALTCYAKVLGFTQANLPPLVLCGDFNAMPLRKLSPFDDRHSSAPAHTALFELFSTGALQSSHAEHPDEWYKRVLHASSPRIGPLAIDWRLQNIYDVPAFQEYSPMFTTKTDDFEGWIDHIWVNNKVDVSMALVPPVRASDGALREDFPPIPNEVSIS